MAQEAPSSGRGRAWHIVVYGGLSLFALRIAWVEQGSGWARWGPLTAMLVALSTLLARWLTEGRHPPRSLHWLVTPKPLPLRTRLLLMLVFVLLGLFAGLLMPVHPR